ncbi:MAG: DegT/DnrJ/EryC1/StrS family aminotransferase [Desulfatibacillaceae bacterium]
MAHSRPALGEMEQEAAAGVIGTGQVASGSEVVAFERELAARVMVGGAVAVSSGTAGLHLALEATGARGKKVLVPTYVCAALAHAARASGADFVPVDVLPETGNMDPGDAGRKLTRDTAAIIAVHLHGVPAEMEELKALGPPVIEDCAQALGASVNGAPAGSLGTVSVFSFYATKVICTGEGGMVASDDPHLLTRIRDMREYDNKDDLTRRYNYKMTDIQAAMGRVQLGRLDAFLEARAQRARMYDKSFAELPVRLPPRTPGRIWFRYVVRTDTRPEQIIHAMAERGVACARPVHRPLHRYDGLSNYGVADMLWETSISLPVHPLVDDRAGNLVVRAFSEAIRECAS